MYGEPLLCALLSSEMLDQRKPWSEKGGKSSGCRMSIECGLSHCQEVERQRVLGRLIDLEQKEFGFFLVILWEAESTVDEPWVSEDVDAIEAAGLKMEKRLPLEGGLQPLANLVHWNFG